MQPLPIDYDLPPQLGAQDPVEARDGARLLVIRRRDGTLAHHRFRDLPEILAPRDLLILNDTRVLPARLLGKRTVTGGKWEGLFLRELGDGTWEMLCQTRGRLQPGERIAIDPGPLALELVERLPAGRWQVRPLLDGSPVEVLGRFGHVPLPPYIRKGVASEADRTCYQTVYARQPGAVAAPTAGLHFTPAVFDGLGQRGIDWSFVTLHVGLGTFRPIEVDDYTQHPMHREWGELPQSTVDAIARCRQRGGRVVAVGTTAVRVLETAAQSGPPARWPGEAGL